jgi:plasmid maintenance system antidote protein VapI
MLVDKGINTSVLAKSTNLPKAEIRNALSGKADMTLDQLISFSEALGLSQEDLVAVQLPAAPSLASDNDDDDETESEPSKSAVRIDPWGNQPEQLFQVAFALGCDFYFLTDTSLLIDSGVPSSVLERYPDKPLPIKLDAAYHSYNKPIYEESGVRLTLSFDNLYDCFFPWASIVQVVFFPIVPEEIVEEPKGDTISAKHPHLRLVT